MIVLIAMLIQFIVMCNATGHSHILFNRDISNEDDFLTSMVGVSVRECVFECADRVSCQSITYRRTGSYCRLYIATENATVPRPGLIYTQRSWWNEGISSTGCNLSCPILKRCQHVGDTVQCASTECSTNPPYVDNADIFGNMYTTGAKVYYSCIDGAVGSNGSSISTCLKSGLWEFITFVCDMAGFIRTYVGYYTTMRKNGETAFGSVIPTVGTRRECTFLCKNETRFCEAVSYYPANGTCILSDNTHPTAEVVGWEIIIKIFPILTKSGPNGRHTLDYSQATELCISYGTTMATYAELHVAYTMGFHWGHCGWVLQGYAYIAIQYELQNTHFDAGVYICGWQLTWNVFCRNPYYKP